MEPWRFYGPVVADFHNFDEKQEQDLDPDPDPQPHQKVYIITCIIELRSDTPTT